MEEIIPITNIEKIMNGDKVETKTRYEYFLKKMREEDGGEEKKLYQHSICMFEWISKTSRHTSIHTKIISTDETPITSVSALYELLKKEGFTNYQKYLMATGVYVTSNETSHIVSGICTGASKSIGYTGNDVDITDGKIDFHNTITGGTIEFGTYYGTLIDVVEEITL